VPTSGCKSLLNPSATPHEVAGVSDVSCPVTTFVSSLQQMSTKGLPPEASPMEIATYVPHTNPWRFMLTDAVWKLPGVENATATLREAQVDTK